MSVRSNFPSEQLYLAGAESLEIVFVKISLKVNLYVWCVYIPPGSNNSLYDQFSVAFKNFLNLIHCSFQDIVLVCGDFNCPIEWVSHADNANNY